MVRFILDANTLNEHARVAEAVSVLGGYITRLLLKMWRLDSLFISKLL